MQKQTKNTLRAFTLIEIMVVIAIMGIMSGLLFVGFSSGQTAKIIEANAREFAGVVREAQNHALSGKQLIVGTDPCRYEINWSGASYSMVYWYKNAGGACTRSSVFATYPLKNGATFASGTSFYFTLPHATLDFSSGSRAAVFTKASATHVACVYFNGRVIDQPGSTCP